MASPLNINWELNAVAEQEGAMAPPTRSRDAEQQAKVRTKSRNRCHIRHSQVLTQQGCSEEAGLRVNQEAKTASHSHGQRGKAGTVVGAVWRTPGQRYNLSLNVAPKERSS